MVSGVRVDVSRPRWHATAALLFPVQGAFEESANATMSDVRVASAAMTMWGDRAPRPGGGPIQRLVSSEDRLIRHPRPLGAARALGPGT